MNSHNFQGEMISIESSGHGQDFKVEFKLSVARNSKQGANTVYPCVCYRDLARDFIGEFGIGDCITVFGAELIFDYDDGVFQFITTE